MMKRTVVVSMLTLLVSVCIAAGQAPEKVTDVLKRDIYYLAGPELAGRRTGTEQNFRAAKYIAERFRTLGLQPPMHDSSGYYCYFPYISGVNYGKGNRLSIKTPQRKLELRPAVDYQPMSFSSSNTISGKLVFVGYGITSKENNYDDYAGVDVKGKVVLAMRYSPDGSNPHGHFSRDASFSAKVANARSHNASAIIFISPPGDSATALPRFQMDRNFLNAGLPVIYAQTTTFKDIRDTKKRTLQQIQQYIDSAKGAASFEVKGYSVEGVTEVEVVHTNAPNVVGILPGNDPQVRDQVIVVGGHFDHLGDGGEGSLYSGTDKAIHYGADDNASGTAGVMALAAQFSSRYRVASNRRTIIFVAFSGEEEGLLGSAYLVEHFPVDLKRVVAMINMDMIGRLDSNKLIVQGTGTSPIWEAMVDSLNNKQFTIKYVKDGFGPSDHSSFYVKDIPVLFFFTGLHNDYHRPTDTPDKINYSGEERVLNLAGSVVQYIDDMNEPPAFTKVQTSTSTQTGSGFRVYVGTIPDYTFEGKGLKLSGVAQGGPAEKAGLKGGDIIIKMGGKDIANIYDYTYLLGELKPKQLVETVVLREGKEVAVKIEMGSR